MVMNKKERLGFIKGRHKGKSDKREEEEGKEKSTKKMIRSDFSLQFPYNISFCRCIGTLHSQLIAVNFPIFLNKNTINIACYLSTLSFLRRFGIALPTRQAGHKRQAGRRRSRKW